MDAYAEMEPGRGILPPHDVDSEAAVLGLVLCHPPLFAEARASARKETFFLEAHRRIFAVMCALADRGDSITSVTVAAELRSRNELPMIGGAATLTRLMALPEWPRDMRSYLEIIETRARARQAIEAGRELMARGYLEAQDIDGVLEQARTRLESIKPSPSLRPEMPWTCFGVERIAEPLPPVPWLVAGLKMAPGPPIMFAGYGFSRKTMAAQDMALSVASGRDVLGVYRPQRGRVVHLDYEQGQRLTRDRYQRLAKGKGIDLRELADDQLRVACFPRFYLAAPEAEELMLRASEGVAFLLIDSMVAALRMEEKDSSIREPLDMLSRVSERTGCTFAVIHHARKPSSEGEGEARFTIRGSSAIFDACSGIFVFGAKKDDPWSVVQHVKERNEGLVLPDFGVRTADIQGLDGDPRWGVRVDHVDRAEMGAPAERLAAGRLAETVSKVTQVIQSAGPMSLRDLRSHVGGRKESVDNAIESMRSNGLLVLTPGAHSSHIYSLNYSTVTEES